MPVVLSDGSFYGTLCAVDPEPRELTLQQADLLVVLARLVATQLERDRAEGELRLRDRAIAASNSGVIITDATLPDNPIAYLNPGFERLTGYPAGEVLGRNCRFMQGEDRDQPGVAALRAAVSAGRECRVELRNYRKDGAPFSCEVSIAPVRDAGGRVTAWVGVQTDVTERKELERRLAEDRFRALVRNSSDVVAIVGADGAIAYASPAVERVLGYRPDEVEGKGALDPELVHPGDLARVGGLFADLLASPGATAMGEVRARHKDGTWRHLEAVGTNLLGDPALGGVVMNYRDITERKEYEEQLRHRALHDPLTGLPNRALFADRLDHALARTARRGEAVAVLYLDLDRYKLVNDSLGHAAGDELLARVGERLGRCLWPGDTAARLGGDEFAVLLEDVRGEAEAEAVAGRILERLAPVFGVAGREVAITASIGVALSGPGREGPEELVRAADAAMYRAKSTGKARFAVYDPGMGTEALERLELEVDLRRALERGELRLRYQPVVELATGRVTGAEALLRWEHPDKGAVPPSRFIPIAEETGLILPIERWVLGEACRQGAAWRARYGDGACPTVGMNLSGRHLQHPDLVGEVARALGEAGLEPRGLTLEITESVAMEDGEATVAALRELRGLGVRLAIDDFGTGYSSLAYLHRFPVDVLKIDRSFVDGLRRESEDTAIVRAVVGLAAALRLRVVAEGVETTEQMERLRALGCELGQGYLFAKPLPAEEVEGLLAGARNASLTGGAGARDDLPITHARGSGAGL